MKNDPEYVNAADLADRYIETVLHSKPELLIKKLDNCNPENFSEVAEKLVRFRRQLIEGLKHQPLPADYEPKDDAA